MYLAAVQPICGTSEEFAEIVNASSGAKRYIEEGILVPDEISDDTLDGSCRIFRNCKLFDINLFPHLYIESKRDRRTNSAAIPFHFNFG